MMEIILDIFEMIINSLINKTNSKIGKRVSKIVRLIMASVFCGIIIVMFFYGGISSLRSARYILTTICWILALGAVGLWAFWCVRIVKGK